MDYDSIAKGYDELYGEEQEKKARIILKHAKIKGKVLDVGCGTGKTSELFGDVIGIDPSPELLKQARIPVVQGKAEALPFKDKSFGVAICLTAIHHTEYKKAISEIKRVAKGFVITVLKKSAHAKEICEALKENTIILEEDKDFIFISKNLYTTTRK